MDSAIQIAKEGQEWIEEALEGDVVGWLTTVAPTRKPQTSVVSFLWINGEILVYSMPDAPKVRNIRLNPAVAFTLNTDRYGDRWVSIEGLARIEDDAVSMADHAAMSTKYAEPMEHWGMDPAEVSDLFSAAIWIRPTKIRSGDWTAPPPS